mmetsp:Transcript_10080/g.40884  ORF Transcript_10080/g.40884 Transcript_10080/m.40884 type:complete len:274 (-) Transcript_10080:1180-2001(-)
MSKREYATARSPVVKRSRGSRRIASSLARALASASSFLRRLSASSASFRSRSARKVAGSSSFHTEAPALSSSRTPRSGSASSRSLSQSASTALASPARAARRTSSRNAAITSSTGARTSCFEVVLASADDASSPEEDELRRPRRSATLRSADARSGTPRTSSKTRATESAAAATTSGTTGSPAVEVLSRYAFVASTRPCNARTAPGVSKSSSNRIRTSRAASFSAAANASSFGVHFWIARGFRSTGRNAASTLRKNSRNFFSTVRAFASMLSE